MRISTRGQKCVFKVAMKGVEWKAESGEEKEGEGNEDARAMRCRIEEERRRVSRKDGKEGGSVLLQRAQAGWLAIESSRQHTICIRQAVQADSKHCVQNIRTEIKSTRADDGKP